MTLLGRLFPSDLCFQKSKAVTSERWMAALLLRSLSLFRAIVSLALVHRLAIGAMYIFAQLIRSRSKHIQCREDVMNNRNDLRNIHSITSNAILCTEVKSQAPSLILQATFILPWIVLICQSQ